MVRPPPTSTLFPYTTLFRSDRSTVKVDPTMAQASTTVMSPSFSSAAMASEKDGDMTVRSEEHTSELQSQSNLVCRLLLEKKNEGIRLHYFERYSESPTVFLH